MSTLSTAPVDAGARAKPLNGRLDRTSRRCSSLISRGGSPWTCPNSDWSPLTSATRAAVRVTPVAPTSWARSSVTGSSEAFWTTSSPTTMSVALCFAMHDVAESPPGPSGPPSIGGVDQGEVAAQLRTRTDAPAPETRRIREPPRHGAADFPLSMRTPESWNDA
ncbi:hypothetical protein NLS1_22970 [Nocardioides sp. LS1]|nr:hypothetical protein NLS1_22970 [Nocardioides sp. LS1]